MHEDIFFSCYINISILNFIESIFKLYSNNMCMCNFIFERTLLISVKVSSLCALPSLNDLDMVDKFSQFVISNTSVASVSCVSLSEFIIYLFSLISCLCRGIYNCVFYLVWNKVVDATSHTESVTYARYWSDIIVLTLYLFRQQGSSNCRSRYDFIRFTTRLIFY